MSYNFTHNNLSEFISFSSKDNYCIDFPHNYGSIICEKNIITNDILLFKTDVLANTNLKIKSDLAIKGLHINISLDENLYYSDNILNHTEVLKKNHTYIQYVNDYNSTLLFNEKHSFKVLGIYISDDYLKSLNLIDELQKKFYRTMFSTPIYHTNYSKSTHLTKELFNSPYHGGINNIYIQSKVFELIYNELNTINQCSYPTIKLSTDDIEALHKAKDIILFTDTFPDLHTLAKKVALNEFKLQYGFKKLFNSTPGQMILEYKMLHAKKLLETSEFSIAEVTNFVGYKHQQSFTRAFIKFFSICPKDVMKSRKYYY